MFPLLRLHMAAFESPNVSVVTSQDLFTVFLLEVSADKIAKAHAFPTLFIALGGLLQSPLDLFLPG